jgi:hypothetical protein
MTNSSSPGLVIMNSLMGWKRNGGTGWKGIKLSYVECHEGDPGSTYSCLIIVIQTQALSNLLPHLLVRRNGVQGHLHGF